jgi:hypothetical protein
VAPAADFASASSAGELQRFCAQPGCSEPVRPGSQAFKFCSHHSNRGRKPCEAIACDRMARVVLRVGGVRRRLCDPHMRAVQAGTSVRDVLAGMVDVDGAGGGPRFTGRKRRASSADEYGTDGSSSAAAADGGAGRRRGSYALLLGGGAVVADDDDDDAGSAAVRSEDEEAFDFEPYGDDGDDDGEGDYSNMEEASAGRTGQRFGRSARDGEGDGGADTDGASASTAPAGAAGGGMEVEDEEDGASSDDDVPARSGELAPSFGTRRSRRLSAAESQPTPPPLDATESAPDGRWAQQLQPPAAFTGAQGAMPSMPSLRAQLARSAGGGGGSVKGARGRRELSRLGAGAGSASSGLGGVGIDAAELASPRPTGGGGGGGGGSGWNFNE